MSNDPNEPEVAVSPTLGQLDDLRSATEEHRRSDEAAPHIPQADEAPYDEEDVTGGPTLGSITEHRFAHHAHHPDQSTGEAHPDE